MRTNRRYDGLLAISAILALVLMTLAAVAQQSGFDGRKFFEELAGRGVDTKGIDGRKFFEEITGKGTSPTAPIDGRRFFEELEKRGVSVRGIDANRLLGEMRDRGVMMPDMVLINRDEPRH